MLHIRPMKPSELDFLMNMHYEAIHILENKPPRDELLNEPSLRKYHEGWGRAGDAALVAEVDGRLVGAVWYRLFDEANKGYGFVDAGTPELGIAISPDHRGQGIGIALMQAIIEHARAGGFPSLSLSVDPVNTSAVQLYERFEFERCGMEGTSWTMKLNFMLNFT
ncbi:ribosomal protein S18 acetylase RimI-like enzyme [Paenibacillus taihuensis]|uniref:Ribosomal protein S18 acetylase RimI-like enzyme n=1 Tax=Paenibacillus taihuensis TaxID=1156355 RepID=A0A3D9R2T1_9BACL|nr:GNAT family N-acetyltransferase [Paenibacillus taihuensis]REE69615.1 ribosomal protein S18 acetylase RimI-like enzyme [Paenibacillus taihuensis]